MSFYGKLDISSPLLADGGMGTFLMDRGVSVGKCPEMLNLEQPAVIEDYTRSFLQAGADIIQTNTFGASPLKLAQFGAEQHCESINRTAVEIVHRVSARRALVYGSIGPCGALLQPYGKAHPDEVREGFERQAGVLIDAGVDVIGIETMTSSEEAVLAIRGVRAVSQKIPLWATMTFDHTPRGFFTIMGVSIQDAARILAEAGANLVGSNCGIGSETMVAVATEYSRCTDAKLVFQPNAGLPQVRGEKTIYPESPAFMAEHMATLLCFDVAVIGSCCGSSPEHTAALRHMLDNRTSGGHEATGSRLE